MSVVLSREVVRIPEFSNTCQKSIGAFHFVGSMEVVHISEGLLTLYSL